MNKRSCSILLIICIFIMAATVNAQSRDQYDGVMGDDMPDRIINVNLAAGQTITINAEAQSGNLDTYLILRDANGNTVAENDDIVPFQNLDSRIIYTTATGGAYTVILTNIRGTRGDYILTIETSAISGTAQTAPDSSGDGMTIFNEQTFTGYMGDDVADAEYDVVLDEGQGLIAIAEATGSRTLDTILAVFDADGEMVAYNDDRALDDTDSEIQFVPLAPGTYTVVVSNWGGTSGDYRLQIIIADADSVQDQSRVQLSGERRTIETPHFIIHYTLEGEDATTEQFAQNVAEIAEDVYDVQVNQMGWPAPVPDGNLGGDSRHDIYITALLGGEEGAELGFAMSEFPAGNNPNTTDTEIRATPGYMVIDRSYDLGDGPDEIERLLKATIAHEFHHLIQFGFDPIEPMRWYYEATSVYIETVTLPPYQDATDYVRNVFDYPEVCFGSQGATDPTGGLLMYGTWLFIQELVDLHGDRALIDLWRNIAQHEYWTPLELTLADYGDTIPDIVRGYHVRNLVRDYELTPLFDEHTVWVENVITAPGNWSFTGRGIQELAANYYQVELNAGVYEFVIDAGFELVGVGVRGDVADVFEIGSSGALDVSGYDHFNVIAFNPDYRENTERCDYSDYNISVTAASLPPAPVSYTLSASQYAPIHP